MLEIAILLFLIVLMVSWFIYIFCKRVIYKLNKRVLPRNLAIVKNGPYMAKFEELTVEEIRQKLILPMFMILGYNTYDMREFQSFIGRADFLPDYVVKKWDHSKLAKNALSVKYIPFKEDAVDYSNNTYDEKYGAKLSVLMDKLYFKSEYYVLTNGCIYLFFNKNTNLDSRRFEFAFNLKSYSKQDTAWLAYYTKQYLFLELSDVYRA